MTYTSSSCELKRALSAFNTQAFSFFSDLLIEILLIHEDL